MTKVIAALVGDKFEDSEYTEPVKSFLKEGHRVVNLGIKKGATVKGKKKGAEVAIEETVENASVNKYDALLIPGGRSPGNLRKDENVVEFVRKFADSGKPVFSICHGPQLLISAGVMKGRKATGYKSIRKEIEKAGARFLDKEVVLDGNMVFSRNPGDLPVFIEASLKKLQ